MEIVEPKHETALKVIHLRCLTESTAQTNSKLYDDHHHSRSKPGVCRTRQWDDKHRSGVAEDPSHKTATPSSETSSV